MPDINWESVWKKALKNNLVFPIKNTDRNSISVSCPTRFSSTGMFSIEITPSFNDDNIEFELLVFNDNVSLDDLSVEHSTDKDGFNALAKSLVAWELSNRLLDRFEISSDGFENEDEAVNALVDYINNKATESGHMFDDKLDELNSAEKTESMNHKNILKSIREGRSLILSKVACILQHEYHWHTNKNEGMIDSVLPLYDNDNKLAAVVTLIDDCLVIDLAKHITAKISLLQSDEEIEDEIISDIDNAQNILANQEIDQLKEVIADNGDHDDTYDVARTPGDNMFDEMLMRVERLERACAKYIKRR